MCKSNIKVDVIIPTYRPDDTTVLLLKKLLKQTYPIHEIHMIDTETGIFPRELENLSDRVRITKIRQEEFNHGGTRHQGAEQSKAEILVYMTQDAIPANEYLIEELIKPLRDTRVSAAYARQLPKPECKPIERFTCSFNYPDQSYVKTEKDLETMGIKTFFCSDVCAAYKKNVYESLGGFERNVIFNEDMIMAAKIIQSGSGVAYASKAKVFHSHSYGYVQQFKRNFDLAVSQADYPEIFLQVKSETEGIRLVKNTARYLIEKKKPWLIISLIMKSGFKYLGYRAGKKYKKLPAWLIRRCTMNPAYWASSEK